MSNKRYQVVFTGRLVSGMDAETVKSNLILDIGLSEEKTDLLLSGARKVLKRFPSRGEAHRLSERLEQAGALCVIEDNLANTDGGSPSSSGESSLITFISRFRPVSRKKRTASSHARSPL